MKIESLNDLEAVMKLMAANSITSLEADGVKLSRPAQPVQRVAPVLKLEAKDLPKAGPTANTLDDPELFNTAPIPDMDPSFQAALNEMIHGKVNQTGARGAKK